MSESVTTVGGTGEVEFSPVLPGARYAIAETNVPGGWDAGSLSCSVVSAGGGYVDSGEGHLVRNESGAAAVDISVIMAPVAAAFRSEIDAPNPNCGF